MKVAVGLILLCNILYYCYGQHNIQKRIVNGKQAVPHSRPYQAHIVMIFKNGNIKICGGALISNKYVLSATHCFTDLKNTLQTIVVLGAHDLRNPNKQYQRVNDIRLHKGFEYEQNKGYAKNDIALIRLPKRVRFSKTIQPVNLPRLSQITESFNHVEAVESGWGSSENREISYILNEGFVEVFADEEICTLPQSLLCSQSTDGHASCVGDSGSPLVFNNTVIGIVSGGYCSIFSYYTRVTSFLDWIKERSDVKILN